MTEPVALQAPKPGPLHEVLVPGTPIAVLEPVIGTERYARLNDYVTWIVLGLAGIGGVLALIIR